METLVQNVETNSKLAEYLKLVHKIKSAVVMHRSVGRGVIASIKEAVASDNFFKRCQVFSFGYDDLTHTLGLNEKGSLFVKETGDLSTKKYFAWYAVANAEPSVLIFDNLAKASDEEIALVKALIIDTHRQCNSVFSKDTLLVFSDEPGYEHLGSHYVERSANMTPLLQALQLID